MLAVKLQTNLAIGSDQHLQLFSNLIIVKTKGFHISYI